MDRQTVKPWVATLYLNYLSKDHFADSTIKNLSVYLGHSIKYGKDYHIWKRSDRLRNEEFVGSVQGFINGLMDTDIIH